jgi:flagellar hook-associated protein 2
MFGGIVDSLKSTNRATARNRGEAMGQITSGIGLVSGIDTASLIDQLLSLESRPKTIITQRNAVLNSQNVAFQDISAKLLSFKLSVSSIITNKAFGATNATSSNPEKVGISSGTSTTPGSYNFTVSRLVTTQQLLTRGYADTESTPVGAGTLTFEFGDARLETDTDLAQTNGGNGISRGKIRITDRSGSSAVVDLSKALTTNDVINAINNTDGINVTASVNDGQFVINDETGAAITNLSVADVGTTGTATSLGLVQSVAADTLTGANINQLGNKSLLGSLNDNNGVGIRQSVADMQFATRDGATHTLDLAGSVTVGDLIQKVSDQTGGAVVARVNAAGTGLELEDTTAGGGTFTVTALNDSTAAADLGLLQADGDADGIITGGRRLAALNTRLLGSLKGGSGVGLGEISITNRAGVATAVDLSAAESVADVLKLINESGAGVTAKLNLAGHGIEIVDDTGSTASNLIIADNSGTAATDLGLAQSVAASKLDSGNLQLQYVSGSTRLASLNSGAGVTRGIFKITDSAGASASVDLTQGNEITIADVLSEINSRGLAINARVNDNGDGIVIEDTGPGTFAIKVEEEGGTIARDLGLLGAAANPGDDFVGSFERTVEIDADDTLKRSTTAACASRRPLSTPARSRTRSA